MARAAYKITDTCEAITAARWIDNQLNKNKAWLETDSEGLVDFTRRDCAEAEWKKAGRQAESVQIWCEKWLREDDWKRLKTTIRAARGTREKKSIEIDTAAWIELKEYADKNGVTLSEAITTLCKKANR